MSTPKNTVWLRQFQDSGYLRCKMVFSSSLLISPWGYYIAKWSLFPWPFDFSNFRDSDFYLRFLRCEMVFFFRLLISPNSGILISALQNGPFFQPCDFSKFRDSGSWCQQKHSGGQHFWDIRIHLYLPKMKLIHLRINMVAVHHINGKRSPAGAINDFGPSPSDSCVISNMHFISAFVRKHETNPSN